MTERQENKKTEGQKCEKTKLRRDMGPEDSPNRKKDPKIPKISQNPKNQNESENVLKSFKSGHAVLES